MPKPLPQAIAVLSLAAASARATPVQWSPDAGGNGDFYERVDTTGTFTWEQARDAAASLTYNGLPGHLVILDNARYAAELQFVNDHVYAPGVTPGYTYWIGAYLPPGADGRADWVWLDGSHVPTSITNNWWVDRAEGGVEEAAVLYSPGAQPGDYGTADIRGLTRGFLVEFGNAPAPLPGDANLNGRIDPDDFALTDRGFNKHLTGWSNGDFNQDGVVNQSDYLLLDQSLRQAQGFTPAFLAERQSRFGDAYVAQLFAIAPEPVTPALCLAAVLVRSAGQRRPRGSFRATGRSTHHAI